MLGKRALPARGGRSSGRDGALNQHGRLFAVLLGTLFLVQATFLFTSQSDLLASHSKEPGIYVTAKQALFGKRDSGASGGGAASVAQTLLEALRAQRDEGVFIDGAGFIPVAVQVEDEPRGGGVRGASELDDRGGGSGGGGPGASQLPTHTPSQPPPSASESSAPAGSGSPPAAPSPAPPEKEPAKRGAAAGEPALPRAPHPAPIPGLVVEAPIVGPLPASLTVGPAEVPPELAASWTPPWPKLTDSPYAYITLVSGNSAARHAIAWIQSLLEVGTRHPIVVLLGRGGVGSPECQNVTWRQAAGLPVASIRCDREDATAEEIVSPRYLDIMRRQGALLQVVGEIPRTRFTETIAGGRHFSWGMSLNKLQIFNMTHFTKLVFMDSDTVAFANLDHLFGPEFPMFTAAITYSCCNVQAAPTVSGGFWVVEPGLGWGLKLWRMMAEGKPQYHRNGTLRVWPNGSVVTDEWYLSDLDLVRGAFGVWEHNLSREAVWPMVHDLRHGYVPGLRRMPKYAGVDDAAFASSVMDRWGGKLSQEGFVPSPGPLWDGASPVFRALDLRYDQCVGHCECLPERDLKDAYFSVHFSCIPEIIHKPSWYETEAHFFEDMWLLAGSCTRYYYISWFYRLLVAAGARLDPPYWAGPPVPIWNATHDVFIRANREDYKKRGIQRKY